MRTPLALVFTTSIFASPALAQEGRPAAPEGDCARAREAGRACSLVFDQADTLEGGVPTATGSQVVVVPPASRTSLIRVRTSFRREIIRAAERL